MLARLKSFGAGIAVAVLAMTIYAVALGCFIALLLLIASMEEGGTTLSNATVPLTEAVILLSQGVGFTAGAITLTLVPLLLTVMLVAMIGVLAARIGTSLPGLVSGAAAWALMSWYASQGVQVGLLDTPGVLIGKSLLVFLVGYGPVALARAAWMGVARARFWDPISPQVRRTIVFGLLAAALIVMALAVAGLLTLVTWVVMGYDGMNTLFTMTDMGTGSRIMTTIASLAWLPNLIIWALSWLVGSGFGIGEAARFTLWSGQGSDLPPLPVFGLLPQAVPDPTARFLMMAVPFIVGLIIGLIVLVAGQGFGLVARMRAAGETPGWRTTVPLLAYPAASSCLAAALVSLASTVVFALSNGALGTGRLAHVGVDVVSATQTVGHGVALGLLAAWLLALVGVGAYLGTRWVVSRTRHGEYGGPTDVDEGTGHPGDGRDRKERKERKERRTRQTRSVPQDAAEDGSAAKPPTGRTPRVASSRETAASGGPHEP